MACSYIDQSADINSVDVTSSGPSSRPSFIEHYEKLSLVPLEEAIVPLIPLVPQVEQMVATVKRARNAPTGTLTPDESASIRLYSIPWKPRHKSFNVILDTALQTANEALLQPWFVYLKLITTALAKLPSDASRCSVYHLIELNLAAHYPPKRTFVWWTFIKCATSIDALNDEHRLGQHEPRTLFIIDCQSSKNIRHHSFDPSDQALLPPGCHFEVVGCFHASTGLYIVHIKEAGQGEQQRTPVSFLPSISPNSKPTLLPPISRSTVTPQRYLPTNKSTPKRYHKRSNECTVPLLTNPSLVLINAKVKACIRALELDPKLTNLDLSRSQLRDQEVKILAKALQENKTVTTLNLHHNCIGPQGAHYLADVLKENETLTCINLECNDISDRGMQYLSHALLYNKTLAVLNVRFNQIRPQGVQYLAAALQQNATLTSIKLRSNSIHNLGARYLGNALKQNQTLRVLELDSNQIGPPGAQHLIDALQENHTRFTLHLEGNSVGGEAKQRLMDMSKNSPSFKFFV